MRGPSHPLFDPAWARDSIEQSWPQLIACGDNMVREGCNILMRCADTVEDLGSQTVVTVLFRQVLVAADAALLCCARGADSASEAMSRQLLEASWQLKFALKDPARLGLYVHVGSLRAQRKEALRFVPGTTEWERYKDVRKQTELVVPDFDQMLDDEAEAVAAANALLSEVPLKPVNDAFDAALDRHGNDVPWYSLRSVGEKHSVRSIFDLATAVGARAEYDSEYRHGSRFVHGGHEYTHRTYDEGEISVSPLRSPDGFRPSFRSHSARLLECMRDMLRSFRPAELADFRVRSQAWIDVIKGAP